MKVISLTNIDTFIKLATYFHNKKRYFKAIHYLKKALIMDSDHLETHSLLAEVYHTIEDHGQALEHYERVHYHKPNDWKTKSILIDLCLYERRYDKAIDLLKERIHWQTGEFNYYKRFKALLLNDTEIQRAYKIILFQLTYLLREEEVLDEAVKYGRKLSQIEDDNISHYLLATIYEAQSDYPKAQSEFDLSQRNVEHRASGLYEQVYMKMMEHHLIPQQDAI